MSIALKINNVKILYKTIVTYKDDMSKFTFNNKIIDNLNLIEKNIQQIDAIMSLTFLKKNIDKLSIEKLFELWNLIQYITYLIKLILFDLEDTNIAYEKQFVDAVNEIEIESVNNLYSNIIVFYKKYKKNSIDLDVNIINEIYDIIQKNLKWTNVELVKESIDVLTDLIKKYPYSVSLYSFIIQKNINDCFSLGEHMCDYILNKIELVKDYILIDINKKSQNNVSLFQSNANLKTFGLTINEESELLKVIIKKNFNNDKQSDYSTKSSLEKLAKQQDICVVIINRVIKNPIEFNLWKLIDKKKAQPYLQSNDMGITQKTIEQFNTIVFKKIDSGKKWDFSIESYGSIDSETFFILENLNNKFYRVLSLYDSTVFTKEKTISKYKIPEFINYVKNKGILPINTRITEYNLIQEKNILKNLFLSIKFDIDEIKLNSQIIESNILRNIISSNLEKEFNKIFKKEFNDGAKIKTNKDIADLIHNNKFIDIFNSIIVEQYDKFQFAQTNKTNENTNPFAFSETLNTFLTVLFDMNTDFRRLIHDFYIKIKIDSKLLTESNIIKQKKIHEIFMELIDSVLKKIISDKRNIYQELIYKNNLLNLNLY
jgi:hypothetical protein